MCFFGFLIQGQALKFLGFWVMGGFESRVKVSKVPDFRV
jgi:hypothetical protein